MQRTLPLSTRKRKPSSNPLSNSRSHSHNIGPTQTHPKPTQSLIFEDDNDDEKENQSSRYNTKSEIEKDVIHASALRTIEAKKKTTTGRVPHKWFPNELEQIMTMKAGSYMKITINDIKNRVRVIENKENEASIATNTTTTSLTDTVPTSAPMTSNTAIFSLPSENSLSAVESITPSATSTTGDNVSFTITSSTGTASTATAGNSVPGSRNKGGRPIGSTKAQKEHDEIQVAVAKNWIASEYMRQRLENNGKAPASSLHKLTSEAISKFDISEKSFRMPLTTIQSRIEKNTLTVWHPGPNSPVLSIEVLLNSIIISAWEINSPLTVNECKRVANHLIESTPLATDIVAYRMSQGTYDPDKPLLGNEWWKLYCKRNRDVVASKVGRKFANMRAQSCTYHSVAKMYNTFEHGSHRVRKCEES